MIASPGFTSLTYLAPTLSNAQLSDAIIHPPLTFPKQSGLTPSGSRTAINSFSVISVNEYAPCTFLIKYAILPSHVLAGALATILAMTSESLLVLKSWPNSSISLFNSSEFTTLPL